MNIFNIIWDYIYIIILSATPIIELRGAIPVAILLGFKPLHTAIICYIGSMLPVPFILFGMKYVLLYAKKYPKIDAFFTNLTQRTLKKVNHFDTWSFWGLFLFVAIPLPTTGVWSGSLAASILNMKPRISITAIALGNLVAAMIITFGMQIITWIF